MRANSCVDESCASRGLSKSELASKRRCKAGLRNRAGPASTSGNKSRRFWLISRLARTRLKAKISRWVEFALLNSVRAFYVTGHSGIQSGRESSSASRQPGRPRLIVENRVMVTPIRNTALKIREASQTATSGLTIEDTAFGGFSYFSSSACVLYFYQKLIVVKKMHFPGSIAHTKRV